MNKTICFCPMYHFDSKVSIHYDFEFLNVRFSVIPLVWPKKYTYPGYTVMIKTPSMPPGDFFSLPLAYWIPSLAFAEGTRPGRSLHIHVLVLADRGSMQAILTTPGNFFLECMFGRRVTVPIIIALDLSGNWWLSTFEPRPQDTLIAILSVPDWDEQA